MNRTSLGFVATVLLLAISACGTTNDGPAPPTASDFLLTTSGAAGRVAAEAGSADPATSVSITAGGTGSGTAAADGSVLFNADFSGATATVSYMKAGQPLTATVSVITLSSRVVNPLFNTGSAPNDMALIDESLFIVNSLDNSVVRHAFDGTELANALLPVASSPSFIAPAADATGLFVARNGDNTVSGHAYSDLDLLGLPGDEFTISDPTAAFIGLGKPATDGRFIYVPRAQILTFGPTTYGDGLLSVLDTLGLQPDRTVETTGRNVYSAEWVGSGTAARLLVLSAGELHFSEDFTPSITTDGYLDVYERDDDGTLTLERAVNLGRIGANVLAAKPDSGGEMLYMGNQLTGDVFKLDLGSASPEPSAIALTDEFTYISDVEFVGETGLLLATSFNTDELFVIDTSSDTVSPGPYAVAFDLSLDPQLLAGAANVDVQTIETPDGTRYRAFVLLGLANAVARVDLF